MNTNGLPLATSTTLGQPLRIQRFQVTLPTNPWPTPGPRGPTRLHVGHDEIHSGGFQRQSSMATQLQQLHVRVGGLQNGGQLLGRSMASCGGGAESCVFFSERMVMGEMMVLWWVKWCERMAKWWWNVGEVRVKWWWSQSEMMVKWWWIVVHHVVDDD